MSNSTPKTLSAESLTPFAASVFEAAGTSAEHAQAIAEVLIWASIRGIDSHGLARVPRYLELLQKGAANPQPNITVVSTTPGVSVLHADRAPGPVALRQAVDLAVENAASTGVASVGVRQTVHTGAIGYYTNRIAEAGYVGIAFVAGMPNMAYTGVKGAGVATSPLSIAVPSATRTPVLLDMATATVALGRIRQYKAAGTQIPEGQAGDADGTPTTDPELAVMPLPLGGAKGSGMSLVFELITSVLVGAPILEQFHGDVEGGKKHRQNALIFALDPGAFGDAADFSTHVDSTVDALKGLPVADGAEGIFVPGDRSSGVAAQRLVDGIPVKAKLWNELVSVAETLNVALPTEN